MLTIGIDVGSMTAKAVAVAGGEIQGTAVMATGWQPRQAGREVYREVLKLAGCGTAAVQYVVGTGYGRACLPFAHGSVTEITCHARGAFHIIPETRLVIDIGGQDSKVILVDRRGRVEDFAMNDKCAAGTGRFLEVMAAALGMDVDEMGRLPVPDNPAGISSMCTVFAESEIISLLAAGADKGGIVGGLHYAVAERVATLAGRMLPADCIVFTGGVAKNSGVQKALEKILGVKMRLPPDPQIIGALGAAVIGQERLRRGKGLGTRG